ncbi:alpha/beta-hydrolase [Rhizodiscina lignyota]|uniref:Alpha/beta-hydrolase n=1 Tax=Rhizodiscina lignyota TaxID=1504668 RepID=A0A9P4IQB5_9PEZI|nr:alpha/beta-hydrolase [Rhizodiscina lignyota]
MAAKSIVIVSGAHHVPAHYERVATALRNAGYSVQVPPLPSMHDPAGVKNFDPDVKAVRDAVEEELGKGNDVVVHAHSYGGAPASQALKGLSKADREKEGLKNGVIKLCYLSAFLYAEGTGFSTFYPDLIKQNWSVSPSGFHTESKESAIGRFYNKQTEAEQERACSLLRPISFATFESLATYAAWKYIPTTYIFCENDHSMPGGTWESMIAPEKGVCELEVVRCDGDHSPFLDRPEWVAKVVRKVAGEDGIEL